MWLKGLWALIQGVLFIKSIFIKDLQTVCEPYMIHPLSDKLGIIQVKFDFQTHFTCLLHFYWSFLNCKCYKFNSYLWDRERWDVFERENKNDVKEEDSQDSKAQYIICQNYKKSCIAHSPCVQMGAWPSWLLQRHHYHYYVYSVHHMLSLCNACKVYWLTCIVLTWSLKKTFYPRTQNDSLPKTAVKILQCITTTNPFKLLQPEV